MKYEKGDKFIIEIKSKLANGLYKIKDFNTLVFDDHGLDRLEQVHEHDGCDGCKYEWRKAHNYPCNECKQNSTDYWAPKTEEIQVGDEIERNEGVVLDEGKKKGIVIDKEYDGVKKRVWLRVLTDQKGKYAYWSEELCHRTGKTYPELIKALEQLPKDGE